MATKKAVPSKASSKKAPAKKAAVKKAPVKKAVKQPFKNHETGLKAGDKAPSFAGIDQNGKKISMADVKGKKFVLYFYPQDDTPTCTTQACNLRDNFSALTKKGIEVIGVSGDGIAKHKKFETKYKLPFRLIADESLAVIKAYDVWGKKQFMGKIYDGLVRTTFLINEKGRIDAVFSKVDAKNHTQQILDTIDGKQ
jgi:peroxiredoxin Q/BCP